MVPLFMDSMDRYFRDSIYQLSRPDENRFTSIDIKPNPENRHFNITLTAATSHALPDIDHVIEYQIGQNFAGTDVIEHRMHDPNNTVDRGGVGA